MSNSKIDRLIDALSGELMILRLPDGPHVTKATRDEALKNAQKIARELFPPAAKPLVWDDNADDKSYGSFCGGTTLYECGTCSDRPQQHYAHSRVDGDVFHGPTRDAVKAACEAHHQSRFLEQLA